MSDRHEWERDAVVWLAGRAIEAAMGGVADETAAGPPDDVDQCRESGISIYVPKPVSPPR